MQPIGRTIVSDNDFTATPAVIALAQNGDMTAIGDRDHAVDGLVQGLARTFSLRSRPILGSQIDAEPDGIPSEAASSDGADGEVEDYQVPVHAPLGFETLSDQLLSNREASLSVPVNGILADPERQSFLTATSSNPALVSALANYSFPDSEGTIELTPAPDQTGEATITVSFVDGGLDNDLQTTADNRFYTQSFRVVVYEATITEEIEPNDSFATAQQLGPVGAQRVDGQVGIEVDRSTGVRTYDFDHFDFEYLGGDFLRLTIEAPFSGSTRGIFDIQASLFQNQQLISSFLLDRETASGSTEFPELEAGEYTLQLVLVNNTTFVTNISQSHP